MIRAATPADAEAISALCQASVRAITEGQPPTLRDHWASVLTPQRIAEILETQWAIVVDGAGFATLDGDDVLGMLYVHPDKQRRGIARALVAAVAQEAARRGTATLQVDASTNAHAAYLALGFQDGELVEKTDAHGVTYRIHKMTVPVSLFA